mgnify:CR=1 FL=1|tara:strand:+ start:1282 stop:1620 length:339 start_codon:yes stop_codon:yes gene_type:complete
MQGSYSLLVLQVVATAAISTARGVSFAGAHTGAGLAIYGVSRTSGAIGDPVPIDCIGTTLMESGAAVTAGAAVEVDSVGRAINFAAGVKVGRALSAASAAGQMVEVLLFPAA